MTQLEEFRRQKDEYFRYDSYSPLLPEDRQRFTGLRYFPENPALRLVAELERPPAPERVELQTSTGEQAEYRVAGRIHFSVDGQPATLTVYESESGDLFIPFRDATSGKETYGAGRYLEPEWVDDEHIAIDFNLAYNPYCAYSPEWSCPIPPAENWLKVPIAAGEKSFHPEPA